MFYFSENYYLFFYNTLLDTQNSLNFEYLICCNSLYIIYTQYICSTMVKTIIIVALEYNVLRFQILNPNSYLLFLT